MPFVVDLLPSSTEIEVASALGLAMAERKSKGLFGRKQYEAIEVLARFALPLKTVTWTPGETTGRCLVFNPQGLVSGSIRFDLSPKIPDTSMDPDTGEEAFLALCQGWTRSATEFTPSTLEFPGLITLPDQVAPLLDGAEEELLVDWEEKADTDSALAQLTEQLQAYTQASQAWAELKQKAYAHRDILAARIKEFAEEGRVASEKTLADLTSQVETIIAARRGEVDGDLAGAQEDYLKRKDMLQEELNRFQEKFKETADNVWRDQIKGFEKSLADNEKHIVKRRQELEDSFKETEKQQQAKIRDFRAELDKRMATFTARHSRLDTALEGFGKGVERRLALYQQQPDRVLAATVELSAERSAQAHNTVFYAARYPGGRWLVLPPQVIGSRGFMGTVSGLFGGLNLPFKPASKLAETLAERIQKLLPGNTLEERLVSANLMENDQLLVMAKAGLVSLTDQGKLDKKHTNLFAELEPASAAAAVADSPSAASQEAKPVAIEEDSGPTSPPPAQSAGPQPLTFKETRSQPTPVPPEPASASPEQATAGTAAELKPLTFKEAKPEPAPEVVPTISEAAQPAGSEEVLPVVEAEVPPQPQDPEPPQEGE